MENFIHCYIFRLLCVSLSFLHIIIKKIHIFKKPLKNLSHKIHFIKIEIRMKKTRAFFIFIVLITSVMAHEALIDDASISHNMCGKHIEKAAKKHAIPPEILWGIAKTESTWNRKGEKKGPWPWALNVKGKSYYFTTKKKAVNFLKGLSEKKLNRVDIGCMQINYRYHHQHFKSFKTMINPKKNVMYGASFLKDLYVKNKNWLTAIAHYHSKRKHRGQKYAQKVIKNMGSPQKWPSQLARKLGKKSHLKIKK